MSNKKVSQLDSALSIALLDLLLLTQVDGNAETGYSSKKITVSDLANKLNSDIQYATDLPDFSDKTITGALQELKDMLISQIPVITTSPAPIANFNTDLALPLKSLKVEIKPKQASGTPTPSNPLPISGTDTVIVTQTGVNLWDEEWEVGSINFSTGELQNSSVNIRSKNLIPIKGNATYYAKAGSLSSSAFVVFFYKADGTYISNTYGGNTTFNSPSNAVYMRFYCGSAYGTTYGNDISINYPSTDTTYHAHVTATTKTVSLPSTVYGGYLDLVSGVLTLDDYLEFNGANSENWQFNQSGGHNRFTIPRGNLLTYQIALCNSFIFKDNTSITDGEAYIGNSYIVFCCDSCADLTAWRTFLGNNNIQLSAKTSTPVTIQLTPEEITALAGVNNVFGDTNGNTTVEYRESIQKYIDEQIASVQALVL